MRFSAKRYRKPGGTIYRWGKNKSQTADMYFPQGNDWSGYRRFNAALMDVEVFAARVDWRSYYWADKHLSYVIRQQSRYRDRHVFSSGSTGYPSDEQFAAATAAEIAARLTRCSSASASPGRVRGEPSPVRPDSALLTPG